MMYLSIAYIMFWGSIVAGLYAFCWFVGGKALKLKALEKEGKHKDC